MHELSLVCALVEQVQELAQVQSFTRVLTVWLSVGALSGAEPSCIDFCFADATRGSILDGARLVLRRGEVELACRTCAAVSFPSDPFALFCATCASVEVDIRGGRDLHIAELEVE